MAPTFTEAATSSPARLVLEGHLPGVDPPAMTAHLTDPDLLTRWWPEEAAIAGDGTYEMRWPMQDWTLRGRYLEHEPGHRVRLTWHWDHEPLVPVRTVLVTTGATPEGTHVTITHGDYGPDDHTERHGHLEGWQYFFERLVAAIG